MDFESYKHGPARDVLQKIGFDLANCTSWYDFRSTFVSMNREMCDRTPGDRPPEDCLILRATSISGALSTGELAVMAAALSAADFDRQANEIWDWSRVQLLDRAHRAAVAAAVMRET